MAFRRRSSGFRPRFSGRRNSRTVPRWTAQSLELNLTAAAPTSFQTLYAPGTTIGAGQYEEESKLVRIVGRICAQATDNGTVATGAIGMGILKTALSSVVVGSTNDPLIATELAARDWLGVYNVQMPPQAGPNGWQRVQDLDIRVQRRMKAEEQIRFVAVNGVGDDITITIDIRILIVIRM